MRTLNNNYRKNIEILKENLKRGMTSQQATQAINSMQTQFERANLYNDEEKQYISELQQAIDDHFTVKISATDAMKALGIEVVRVK